MSKAYLRDKWLKRLADEDKAHAAWRKRAKNADDAFCDYREEETGPLFPIFPTTINLIHGRIYGNPPKPDIRARYSASSQAPQAPQAAPGGAVAQDPSQAGAPAQNPAQSPDQQAVLPQQLQDQSADDNALAICVERALQYTIDSTSFDRDAHMAVQDFLIAGLGCAKVELDQEVELIPVSNPMTGEPLLDEEGQPLQKAVITSQTLNLRHFHWSQFRWEPCKDWRQCNWVAFDHYLTKEDIEDQFGVKIEYTGSGGGSEGETTATGVRAPLRDKYEGTYTVHEIWDKRKKMRYFLSDCYDKLLEEKSDPLELSGFFPCPLPMMSNVSGKEMLPAPDYWQYESLIKHINTLAKRIFEITKQVKDIAFYDQSFGELKAINEYNDGTFIAVPNLLDRLRTSGAQATTESVVCQLPMADKVAVLKILSQELEDAKAKVYEINGIADIQRGVSNAAETATAQTIKNQWADIRTGQRVQTVAFFFRDVFRIMAEIISSKFMRSQIQAMTGILLTDQQMETMRSGLAESYAIEVESDSTMVQNDSANQEALNTFLQTFMQYLPQLSQGVQSGAVPADLAREVLMKIVGTMKAGRDFQQAVQTLPDTMQQLQQLTQQSQQAQQQAQQLQEQNQQLQQQLQQTNDRKEAREDARTQADVASKNAETAIKSADLEKRAAEAKTAQANAVSAAIDTSIKARHDVMEGVATGIQ